MSSLSSTSINNLEDLRTTTQELFDQQKLSAKIVLNVNTQRLPARIISFQYYGNSNIGQDIANLNSDINVSSLSGDIDILTE